MATTIYAALPRYSGETLTLYLYDPATGSAINSGGDAMTENVNGAFSASVDESISQTLRADVQDNSGNILGSDFLYYGETTVGRLPVRATTGTTLPGGVYYNTINRDDTDTDDVYFEWGSDDTSTSITATVSIDGGTYTAIAGTVSYVREEAGAYLWSISYDSTDRPSSVDVVQYLVTDGTDSRIIPIIINSGGSTAALSPSVLLSTTIDSVTSTTEFVLDEGSPNDDTYNNQIAVFSDSTTSEQVGTANVTNWEASSLTLSIEAAPVFAPGAGDSVDILAVVDVADISTAVSSILSVANVPVGGEDGFPSEILVGDAYTMDNGREIKMYFYDEAGNVITQFGNKSPSDSDFTWYLRFAPTSLVDGVIVNAQVEIVGDENDWNTDDPDNPYLIIEMPSDELDGLTVASGKFIQSYTWQLILQWGADDTYELTPVTNGQVTVRRKFEAEV